MSKLFIYYSHTGNGELVSKTFESQGYEIRKVEEEFKMPKAFFFQMMVGGFRAGTNQKGKLIDYNNDVTSYDEVVIGSPIWNGKLPPATNSIIAETNLEGKKLSFVLYSGGGEAPKAEERIKSLYKDVIVIHLQEPKKYDEQLKKLDVLFAK